MTGNVDVIRGYTVPAGTLDGPSENRTSDSRDSEDALMETVSGLLDRGGTTEGDRVVGLGEVTHGTRECFRLKMGLVGLLVREFGVRTVAFEADISAACALDAYVRKGEGDPETALAGLEKWMWRVESVRDLLSWLRSFNRGRPPTDQVSVRGVDLSRPATPAEPLRSYFERVDPSFVDSGPLARLATVGTSSGPVVERALDEATAAARAIEERLLDSEEAYVDAAGRRAWTRARHLCRVVKQTCDWSRVRHETTGPNPEGMARRDQYMAANVGWCVEQDPNGRVAVWAHNSHVKRGTFDDGQVWTDAATMGEQLAREFGDCYTSVGFDVGRGRFRAAEAGETDNNGPRQFALGEPADGTATAQFDAVGNTPWLLDVRAAAADPRLRDWLNTPQRIRWVGTVYDPDAPGQQYLQTPLTGFDGLLFLSRSTPSRPLGASGESRDS